MPGLKRIGELVRLEIPAQPAFVGVARSVVAAVASSLDGIDDDRLEDLRVAVSEACTNAVEAHRRDAIDDRVVIRCTTTLDALEVCIEDSGGGFDPSAIPAPPGPDAPPTASERGWGVQLIRALVDDAAFRDTDEGTAVDLVMRFNVETGVESEG
ncbi:MAG: serine/threonine-protein kinase RsbW [Actinomycetota bacterium]|nr:serine/threonine-protein kinase RsbW [Actinomycetota bacterium]